MSYQQYYGGLIWTNHAIERLSQRGLSQELAWTAFKNPDSTRLGSQQDATEYIKRVDTSRITLIAKQNEKREWIVLSCWIDPPLPGSIDAKKKERYLKYQKASFWGKFFLTLKNQLGL